MRERDQRLAGPVHVLVVEEDAQHQHARGDHLDDRDRTPDPAPVMRLALDQAVDQQEQADGGEAGAGPVEPVPAVEPQVGHRDEGEHDGQHADRDVDEEDPLPAEVGDQIAAQGGAGDRGDTGHRTPHAERDAPLVGREDHRDRGQRLRREQRAADTLDDPEHDELLGRAGQAARGRRDGEDHQPEHEQPLGPEEVTEPAGGDQEDRVDQHVRVDDPEDLVERRVEARAHVGYRDIDDRRIEQDHEEAQAERRQHQPRLGGAFLRGRCGHHMTPSDVDGRP